MLRAQGLIALVSRRKAGAYKHFGVLLPDDRVAHCAPGRGEHISSIEEFSAGEDVTIERLIPAAEHPAILSRIAAAMQAPLQYDLTTNNCEIFANRVTGQKAESAQLHGTVLLAGFALFCLAAARA
jgi:hypothetical protein